MLNKLALGAAGLVLALVATSGVASGEETKTIKADGVPVELENLWTATPTVEVTVADDLQLTISGLGTIPDLPADRHPDTLAFYIYPDFPAYTNQCLMTPQPNLTTLPDGAVSEPTPGSFVLTYDLEDLEQNACLQSLAAYIDDGPFGSRLEVSDQYGSPVLYSEPFIADFGDDELCFLVDPTGGIARATDEVETLDLEPDVEAALVEALDEANEKLMEDPPDRVDARDKIFGFIEALDDAVESGDVSADDANVLLDIAAGLIASLDY